MTRLASETEGLLPEGEYVARIEDIEEHFKDGRLSSLHWWFVIPQGVDEYRLESFTGIRPGKDGMTRAFLKGLGLEHKGELDFDEKSLAGKWCKVSLRHEEFRERMQMKVVGILEPAEPAEGKNGFAGPEGKADADPFAEC